MSQFTTLKEFISQNKPELLSVFQALESSAIAIQKKLSITNLENTTGLSGGINGYGESVQKLDEFGNQLLVDNFLASGTVMAVMSEELLEPAFDNNIKDSKNSFVVAIDPIDGSPNLDINLPVGTIFGVYNNFFDTSKDLASTKLPKGNEQIAAGYVLYSNSMNLIFTFGGEVFGFVFDPQFGTFVLYNDNIQIPADSKIYSINEGNYNFFTQQTKDFLTLTKTENYKLRYVGSMVGDIHRTIIKGGIFLYPSDSNNPNGKLRLLYEINPMSFLIHAAGGISRLDNGACPLELQPKTHDEIRGVVIGSTVQVQTFLR
jgi:fructose-1,6-bisphosphatase I